jgi:site-specific DNA recombinase
MAFELIATGKSTQKNVIDILEKQNMKVSRTQLSILLRNPLYKGFVLLKALGDEPEELIKGIHEPIVSEYTFQKVQEVLASGKKNKVAYKTKNLNKYPLRGLIICDRCGNHLTASSPKGNGGHYDYYHCTNGCKKSFSTKTLHKEINEIITRLSPRKEIKELYLKMLKKEYQLSTKNNTSEKGQYIKSIIELKEKLKKTQDIFIDGTIEKDGSCLKVGDQGILKKK